MAELPTIPLTWGNGIGNALSSGAQARYYSTKADTEQADEQRKKEALPSLDAAMKGDPTAMGKLAYGDPKAAVAISTALQRMDANQRAKIKEQAEYSTTAANAILQANPAERPAVYRELHAEGVRRGYDMSRMPPEYTPQVDPMLRTYRQMGIDLNKQLDRDVRLQIHNTPGGGSGGELAPIMTPGAAPTPTPQPAAPSRPMSSVVPPGAPPTSVAQAPQDNEGTFLSADPSIKAQPQRSGPMFYEDPTPYGYVMAQDRRKPGQPVIDEHGIRYINPQTKEVVIFKPMPPQIQERLQPPPGYQRGQEGGLAPIPGGPEDPATIQRNAEVRRAANEKAIPQTVTKGMQENLNALKQIDRVDAILEKVPASVGGPGSVAASIIPGAGWLQNRMDPEGVNLRALVADIGSLKIHDRSGAAVTASEFPRLRPFIPTIADDPPTIRSKLANFRAEYTAMLTDSASYYGPENGFKPYGPAVEYLKGSSAPNGAAPSPSTGGGPKPGAVEDGYRFKGGDPSKRESWEKVQ